MKSANQPLYWEINVLHIQIKDERRMTLIRINAAAFFSKLS